MKKLILLLPTTGYRNQDFLDAADKLQIDVIPVANYCHKLAPAWGLSPLQAVEFDRPQTALASLVASLGDQAPDAVLAVDDMGLELACLLNKHFCLPGNPLSAIQILRDKLLFRSLLHHYQLPCPEFVHLPEATDVPEAIRFPVVVKPRRLSGSRGVIRANNALELRAVVQRVRRINAQADRLAGKLGILIESFIPGEEFAVEALLRNGKLHILACFAKPDPLNGPYFEETLYVTPSGISAATQQAIHEHIEKAVAAAGLVSGPIHAELRINPAGVWLLEIAPRSIGGLCGRILRYILDITLEEFILRDALGLTLPNKLNTSALAVMMIPIPQRGILRAVTGMELARATPYIVDLEVTAERGQLLVPLPEGSSYLGFLFAQAPTPEAAATSLRLAHAQLRFDIAAEVPLEQGSELRASRVRAQ